MTAESAAAPRDANDLERNRARPVGETYTRHSGALSKRAMRSMLQTIGRFWAAATGQKHPDREPAERPAVLHDPAAHEPHDLDDPYFDPKVQKRVGDVIANAMQDKR
jgi:hypothetical protein